MVDKQDINFLLSSIYGLTKERYGDIIRLPQYSVNSIEYGVHTEEISTDSKGKVLRKNTIVLIPSSKK